MIDATKRHWTECEICGGYLVDISQGNRRKCERCGHIQYVIKPLELKQC